MDLRSPLLGRFNLDNLLAAVAGAVALELPADAIAAAVAATRPLPGRLEPVTLGPPFPVLVDYAHTAGRPGHRARCARRGWAPSAASSSSAAAAIAIAASAR